MDRGNSMRDFFFNRLYERAKEDRNIVLVSADMNAPSLVRFMKELSDQYVDTGIAEASAATVAQGLAREGKKPFVYAIAPFVTTRIHEFAKMTSAMHLPVTFVGVGAGFSYDESGPTHHTTEDIAIMRAIPGMHIYSPADGTTAAAHADMTADSSETSYVRLDRQNQSAIYSDGTKFTDGFKVLTPRRTAKTAIVSTGNMVHNALEVSKRLGRDKVAVIDLHRLKPTGKNFLEELKNYDKIVTLEEHQLAGGLGSLVLEQLCDAGIDRKVMRVGVNDQFTYQYGGRANIQKSLGLDVSSVTKRVRQFAKI